jgi:hypothetical protein
LGDRKCLAVDSRRLVEVRKQLAVDRIWSGSGQEATGDRQKAAGSGQGIASGRLRVAGSGQ